MEKIWYPVKIQFLSLTCEDITVVMTTSVSVNRKLPSLYRARSRLFHSQISHPEKQDGFSNQLPNFDINIFDDEQNEWIDGRFAPMTDSEVDNLTETGETANTKRKTLYGINLVYVTGRREDDDGRSLVRDERDKATTCLFCRELH